MDSTRSARRAPAAGRGGYWRDAASPLYSLALVVPMLAAYEVGVALFLSPGDAAQGQTIKAWSRLMDVFRAFGLAGSVLPALALVSVLVVTHVLERSPWRLRGAAIAGMCVEVAGWTLLALMAATAAQWAGASPRAGAAHGPGVDLLALPWTSRLTISLGAGLYEEMLFRMIGVALVHTLVVNLARGPERAGRWAAVLLTAGAFAAYHGVWGPAGLDLRAAGYFFGAGVFFALLFLARGFGITAGVHALFDAAVLVILPALS